MNKVEEVLVEYIKEIDGIKYFCCDDSNKRDYNATNILAEACQFYIEDVDEELYKENEVICLNCRYRRWEHVGFTCLKEFKITKY